VSGPAPAAWALRFCSTEGQRRASHCSPSGPALPSLARDVVSLRAGAARARVASPAPAAADERRQAGRGHPQRGRERDPVHAARGLHQLLCATLPTLDPTLAYPATSERRTSHAYVTGARSPAQHFRAELASVAALESCDRPGGVLRGAAAGARTSFHSVHHQTAFASAPVPTVCPRPSRRGARLPCSA